MTLERLAAVARLIVAGAPLSETDRTWLRRRLDREDWIEGDQTRVREMLSPAMWRLLAQEVAA
jgi:hypothetical protein